MSLVLLASPQKGEGAKGSLRTEARSTTAPTARGWMATDAVAIGPWLWMSRVPLKQATGQY